MEAIEAQVSEARKALLERAKDNGGTEIDHVWCLEHLIIESHPDKVARRSCLKYIAAHAMLEMEKIDAEAGGVS